MNSNTIYEQRLHAAQITQGISTESVYQLVVSICKSLGAKGNLLDYGAGSGSLLKILQATLDGVSLYGADILKRPADLPEEVGWFELDLNQSIACPDGFFDTIVSSEVIEHLENPRAMYRDVFRLLKPGGHLVVTTPNQESLRSILALILSGHFAYFSDNCYPAHITALVRKDFDRIALETGFEKVRFEFSNQGGIPKAPHVKWQKLFPFLKGRWFSDNIAAICRKPQ